MRGRIFINELAYLSEPQNITASRINQDISAAPDQIEAARRDLVAVQNEQQAQVASVTIQALKWLAAKTKLLICAGAAIDTGGLALVACAKPLMSFLKQSEK